jgi:hypothetical protein
MTLKSVVLSGCTVGAIFTGGNQSMSEVATSTTYRIPAQPDKAVDVIAVRINGEVRLVDRQAARALRVSQRSLEPRTMTVPEAAKLRREIESKFVPLAPAQTKILPTLKR